MKTKITELLGIKYPIFKGAMASISDGKLAAASSNAGGLGIIATGSYDAAWLEEEIAICKKLTDKPFGVNIIVQNQHAPQLAQLVADKRVDVVTTGAGSPKGFLPLLLDAGCKVIPVIANVSMATKMTAAGVSALIAEGHESGGFVGDLTTMALLPQVRDATNLPVIAAGGIADGRQAAAAFLMGADAVQIGTRFLVAHECDIPQVYKDKVIAASDTETMVTGRRLKSAVRALRSPLTIKFAEMEADNNVSDEELAKFATGATSYAAIEGNFEKGSFCAGQVAGMIKKEQSSADIIEEIMEEMKVVLKNAPKIVS